MESPRPNNLFDKVGGVADGEFSEKLAGSATIRIERIVSRGQASPPGFWYDQEWAEWVVVLKGQATLRFDGRPAAVEMGPGDWMDIPPHARHRVEWTDPEQDTVWLAVHYR